MKKVHPVRKTVIGIALFIVLTSGAIRIFGSYHITSESRNDWHISISAYSRFTIKGYETVYIKVGNSSGQISYSLRVYNFDHRLRDEQVQIFWVEDESMALIRLAGDEFNVQVIPVLFEPELHVVDIMRIDGCGEAYWSYTGDAGEPVATPMPEVEPENAVNGALLSKIGLTAEEISADFDRWELITNMFGWDYYGVRDGQRLYLFWGSGYPIEADSECLGVSTTLEQMLQPQDSAVPITIEELSELLEADFRWSPNEWENEYKYVGTVSVEGELYQVMLFSDAAGALDWSCEVQATRSETNIFGEQMMVDSAGLGEQASFDAILEMDSYLYYIFNFPQINGVERELARKLNAQFRRLPFEMLANDMLDVDELMQGNLAPLDRGGGYGIGEISYEILLQNEDFVSVVFHEEISSLRQVHFDRWYATFDLKTGERLAVDSILSVEEMVERMQGDAYEIEEGAYLPGGWEGHEPELKTEFIGILEQLAEGNARSNCNFGITENSVLICFYYWDSLDGYVVLKFER